MWVHEYVAEKLRELNESERRQSLRLSCREGNLSLGRRSAQRDGRCAGWEKGWSPGPRLRQQMGKHSE